MCSKRKSVANNSFLKKYDATKPTSYILYLEATNLYGAVMKESLPTGNLRWLTNQEIGNFDHTQIGDDSTTGYVFEVDLEYPIELHDEHNDLPFCPEQMVPPNSKCPNLTQNLNNKKNYLMEYRNLKQCLKYGLRLQKIHRVLEFSQSSWLGSYIDLNSRLRNGAKNEFVKDLFKLMVNSIFGKTMENVEKRKSIRLCSSWENKTKRLGARSLIALPNLEPCSIFDEYLVAIQLQKTKVLYDKPLYVNKGVWGAALSKRCTGGDHIDVINKSREVSVAAHVEDEGGPLMCNGVQIGVISFTYRRVGCGILTVSPAVFTRIDCYLKFIYSAMQDSGGQEFVKEAGIDLSVTELDIAYYDARNESDQTDNSNSGKDDQDVKDATLDSIDIDDDDDDTTFPTIYDGDLNQETTDKYYNRRQNNCVGKIFVQDYICLLLGKLLVLMTVTILLIR